jgi:putative copper resistance protein D
MLLVLARALFVGCVLSGFGAALFALMTPVARRLDARQDVAIERHVREVMQWSLAAALVSGCVWLVLQARTMAGTTELSETIASVPTVLFGTRFGQVLTLQVLMIVGALAAAAMWRWRSRLTAALAGTAVLLEAGHSHAFAMAHVPLLISQMLHLTAAGAWLGGLIPLLIVVREAPLDLAQHAARRFSMLGTISVVVLAATVLFQGALLSGGLAGLTGTRYGAVLVIKAVLFAVLILIAGINRFRLTPAMAGPDGETARGALTRSIILETFVGLCVVIAASWLSNLEPGMHMEAHSK